MASVTLRLLAVAFVSLLVAPTAAADHPDSVQGLAFLLAGAGPGDDRLVHRVTDVELAFAEWEAAWPEYVDGFSIGVTTTGLPVSGVVVTDEVVTGDVIPLSTPDKVRVYLDGGHHGNEYLGVELVMYYLEDLLTRAAAGDEDVLALLATTEIHAVPLVNPEGNAFDTRKNGRQVDLNRNYPFEFGGPGSGDLAAELNYRGPAALSEPETAANAAFAEKLSPDVWVTMHTGIAEFYWPWGWTHDASPDDALFTGLEAPFEAATNGRVDAMQGAELYLAAGAADDFGYGALGIASFTYEVHEDQFVPAYGEPIPTIISEQLAGLDWVVRNAAKIGAWVEPRVAEGGLLLTNEGWGLARDVTVRFLDRTVTLPELAPGATVTVAASLAEAQGAAVTYPVLLVDTSRERTHLVVPDPDGLEAASESKSVPASPALGVLVAVALVAVARRLRTDE